MIVRALVVLVGLVVPVWAFQAHAITENLTCAYLTNLTANDGCDIGTTNNDTVGTKLQVNADSMFDTSDWVFAEEWTYEQLTYYVNGKTQTVGSWAQGDQGINVGLTATGTGTSGKWTVTGVWDDIMLVLKGPNGSGTTPVYYVAYLLESADGYFSSPFTNKNGKAQDISNMTVYVRGVPEPTAIALLGVALAAVAITARRRAAGRRPQMP